MTAKTRKKSKSRTEDYYPNGYEEEVEALEKYLDRLFKPKEGFRTHVYAFIDDYGGFRVSEVDISCPTSGSSFMRSTFSTFAMALILGCEDFVRTFHIRPYRPSGWESFLDEHLDAKEKLRHVIL